MKAEVGGVSRKSGERLRYWTASPVDTLSTAVRTQPDSAQFPDVWKSTGEWSPPAGLPLGSQTLFRGRGGRVECSGRAHPHFGLSLCLSLHGQRVLKPGRQPHVLTAEEDRQRGCAS